MKRCLKFSQATFSNFGRQNATRGESKNVNGETMSLRTRPNVRWLWLILLPRLFSRLKLGSDVTKLPPVSEVNRYFIRVAGGMTYSVSSVARFRASYPPTSPPYYVLLSISHFWCSRQIPPTYPLLFSTATCFHSIYHYYSYTSSSPWFSWFVTYRYAAH